MKTLGAMINVYPHFCPTAAGSICFLLKNTCLISFKMLNLFNIFEISLCISKSAGTVLVYTFMLDKIIKFLH